MMGSSTSLTPMMLPMTLSTLAGLSTCVGAAAVFAVPNNNHEDSDPLASPVIGPSAMSFTLAFAGSVMVTVSLISLIPESYANELYGGLLSVQSPQFRERTLYLGLGGGLYALLSKFLFPEAPEDIFTRTSISFTPNDTQSQSSIDINSASFASTNTAMISTGEERYWRLALLMFASLAIHNFPEGLAVAATTLHSSRLGLTTALAIALHNVPEGIAIAIPCLAARPKEPWLAFGLASLSGYAEPLGAWVAISFLRNASPGTQNVLQTTTSVVDLLWYSMTDMHNMLAFVAGIMTTVAVNELFPEALRHQEQKHASLSFGLGAILGAVVMVVTETYLSAATS